MSTNAKPADFSGSTLDRTTYLGGSEIGAVAGLSPYATALDVWASKVEGTEKVSTEAMGAGTYFEGAIVGWYAQRLGIDAGSLAMVGTCRSAQEPWIAATPDRVMVGTRRTLQAKMVGVHGAHRWGTEDDGPDGVPAEVLAQVQWEMLAVRGAGVVEAEAAVVVAQIGTEQRVYTVPFDADFAGDLVELGRAFWTDHVLARRMPEVTAEGAEAARQALARRYPRHVRGMAEATPDVIALARLYEQARRERESAAADVDLAAAKLQALIADGEGFEGSGVKVTWKANASGGTDWKGLAQSLVPTAEQMATYARPGARVLRVTVK